MLKAPFFNALLFFTMLGINLGRAYFYFFAASLVVYFTVYLLKNFAEEWSLLKETILNLKHVAISFLLILMAMTISNIANDFSNLNAWHTQFKFFLKIPILLLTLLFFYRKGFFSLPLFYCFVTFGLCIQALDGLFQATTGYDFFRETNRTLCQGLTGATTNRNFFGYLVGFGIIIFLQLTFHHKKFTEKAIYGAIGAVFFFCILYSLSRGVWFAVIVSLSFLFLYHLFTTRYKRSFFILTVLLLLIASIFTVDCLASRTIAVVQGSSSARYPIWKEVTELIMQKPIFGWGMEKMGFTGNYASHVHNVLLEIILYTGLLGLLTFAYCLYNLIKGMLHNKQIFLFSILVYILIRCLFDHTFFSGHLIPISITILMFLTFAEDSKRKFNTKAQEKIQTFRT